MIWAKDTMATGGSNSNSSTGQDLADTWVELESDPGLFTLLIEDFGVKGVQVEEIYDLYSPASLENSTVFGFIFLFKWVESGRRGRGAGIASSTSGTTVTDENVINRMFFAQQIVTNACATHALLSILLNCDEEIELGDMLTHFKRETYGMSPEAKGNAVGRSAPLTWAHNKHATPSARRQLERDISTPDTGRGKSMRSYRWKVQEQFHFISYVPINGRLYELDGLKPHPVDHGEIPPGTLWTQHFQNVISERIELVNSILDANEIRYNLMALVPSKLDQLRKSVDMLKMNRQVLYNGLEKLLEATDPKLVEVARQQANRNSRSVSSDENDNGGCENNSPNNWDSSQSRVDTATLIGAAKNLDSTEDAASLIAPLTVVTSSGKQTVVDLGVSSGATDHSALMWPIKNVEVVTVTKDEPTGNTEDGNAPSASPLSSLSGRDDAEAPGTREDNEPEQGGGSSRRVDTCESSDSPQWQPKKASLVVKLETTGSTGFRLLGPVGLVTYVRRLEEKMDVVERLLSDEMANRDQWEIDDERRTFDYDDFARTFLTMLVEHNIVQPEPTTKNGKPKARRAESRGGPARRKKRS